MGSQNDTDASVAAPATIPDHVGELIAKLHDGKWSPTGPVLPAVRAAKRGGTDHPTPTRLECRAIDDELVLFSGEQSWKDSAAVPTDNERPMLPLSVTFEDGSTVTANDSFDSEYSREGVRITCWYWEWRNGKKPSIWIARVAGELEVPLGNVYLSAPEFVSSQAALRLDGAYSYYLVRRNRSLQEDRWRTEPESFFLIIDTGGAEAPVRKLLAPDFWTLEFLLGQNLRIAQIFGLDDQHNVVAVIGGELGDDQPRYALVAPAVPRSYGETWIAPFFQAISSAYRLHPEWRLYIPMRYYVDSLSRHMDGGYLDAHVGLEAFAYWLLRDGGDEPAVVRDPVEWRNWVEDQRQHIERLALDGHQDSLVERVKNVYRLATSRIVRTALQRFGIPLHPELKRELEKGRGNVAHTAQMSDPRDNRDERKRQGVVRSTIIALMAKAVGYDGAISGWEHYRGEPPEDWWIVGDKSREMALLTYQCTLRGGYSLFHDWSVPT